MGWLSLKIVSGQKKQAPPCGGLQNIPTLAPGTWPEAWRERREERAALMQHGGGLDHAEAERAATLYTFAAMCPDSFPAAWLAEVETMRRGDNPDWIKWPPEACAAWARGMIEMAEAEAFLAMVPGELAGWLAGCVKMAWVL